MSKSKFLTDFIGTAIESLEQVRNNGAKREFTFDISCAELEDFNHIDIRESDRFRELFEVLKSIEGPVLYWFEIISETDSRQLIGELSTYKSSRDAKATPALKVGINYDSKILYVGKVKTAFWGRLIQHLGYYKVSATQGLQLFYWAKPLCLNLKVNLFEFDREMADFMPVIEYAFAKKFQPLIGKHK